MEVDRIAHYSLHDSDLATRETTPMTASHLDRQKSKGNADGSRETQSQQIAYPDVADTEG